jgi:hypothetical protein
MPREHTPGPWKYDGVESRLVVAAVENSIEHSFICDVLDTTEGLEGDCPEADANGRLIAAAPDLLAACRALVETFELADLGDEPEDGEYGDGRRALNAGLAAIAKATGQG